MRIWEQWTIQWTPEFDARCIEAAIYGATVVDAATARLLELAENIERNAEKAAILLLDACLMGLHDLSELLYQRFVELIRQDNNFFTTTKALGHLLYLYRYDEVLGTTGRSHIGTLLVEIFQRSLWLLEGLGQVQGTDRDLLQGLRTVLETFECCSPTLELNRDNFVQILHRVSTDLQQTPLMQGAATGALWTLGEAPMQQVIADLGYSAHPDRLGDFLTGLFCLARETAQRHPELVLKIDDLLLAYDDEAFLEALPALRLAFSYFTPREKHHMAQTLLQLLGGLPNEWQDRDAAMGFLYDREYRAGRNVRQGGKGQNNKNDDRKGSLAPSQLTVPNWINAVHELFPRQTIERLEKDALERYQLEEMVTNPDLLSLLNVS